MNWLLLPPIPLLSPFSKLDGRHTGRQIKIDNVLTGERVGGGSRGGAKSYDGKYAWSSIIHDT
jgi:hypothetical protein